MVNRGGGASVACGRIGDTGGVSRRGGSILQAGRKRAARQSGRAWRRSLGRCGTAAEIGGHSGGLSRRTGRRNRGRESEIGREKMRERERERAATVVLILSRRLGGGVHRRGNRATGRAPRRSFTAPRRRQRTNCE
jgi:hypothetical protein